MTDNTNHDPKEEAQRILEQYWAEGEFPVDPAVIAHRMNVKVLVTIFDDPKISGAVMKEENGTPEILVNKKDSSTRMRFTLAHELGHIVQNDKKGDFVYIDHRNQLASDGTDKDEIFANQFAACLLMPEEAVKAALKLFKLTEIAQYFNVSDKAMKYRLLNLRIMS